MRQGRITTASDRQFQRLADPYLRQRVDRQPRALAVHRVMMAGKQEPHWLA